MDTIEKMFSDLMHGNSNVELIPKDLYAALREMYYMGFARGCMVYETDLEGLTENQKKFEIYLLKKEYDSYLDEREKELNINE